MANVDVELLGIFIAVAETSSFSKAARKLGVSKGTISRGVSRLEALVGAELIHRTTRSVALSTAGIALHERTAPLLTALEQAVGKLSEREEQPSGVLRLTAPHDMGAVFLPELLAGFSKRFPSVSLDVRLTNRSVDLVAEGFDVAIRAPTGRLASSSLTMRKLGTIEGWIFASPGYIARNGEPKEIGEAGHEWATFCLPHASFGFPKGVRPRFSSDDFYFLRAMIRTGTCVGALPTFLGGALMETGELVRVVPSFAVETGEFVLLYPSSGQVPKKVIAFRDFVVEWLKVRPLTARA